MLITTGYWPPFWHCVSPAEDRAFVHCRHLMTVILNTHRMLSRFCLHSYHNEVLGGPHLSVAAGLQLFAGLWPGFNSQAYKLSLNSVEQGPFNPLLSPSPDKCCSAASPRHMPPSYLLLAALSDGLLCILERLTVSRFISVAAGSPAWHGVYGMFYCTFPTVDNGIK